MRRLKWLALLLVVTVLPAVAAACNGSEGNGQATGTPGSAATLPPSTGTPAGTPVGTPAPTLEPRPTLTPGAYQQPPGSANVLGNPGFEEETAYWFALYDQTVTTSNDVAHSGLASAHLVMRDDPETTGAKVYYLVQEVDPSEFPELISGYYRIDNWRRGTEKQYLQFVVIVWGPTNMGELPNYQIRYPLVGISEQPFPIGNAFFKFLSRDFEPRQGDWVYFESNIRNDFQELWKAVPEDYSKIRVLFEVRYDDKEAGLPAEADVYYDDLYMGPADANPNKP